MEPIDLSGLELPEKEKKILEAAVSIFSEKGFSAATTSEIAKHAGIAEGTIFRYFKTKKDILRGILVQMISLMSKKLVIEQVEKILLTNEDKDLRSILKEMLYDRLKLVETILPMARIVFTEALYHEDVREAIYENIISKAVGVFRIFHQRMMAKGVLREDVEPEAMLRSIIGNIALFIAQHKVFGSKFQMEDLDKEFDKVIDIMMYGFAKRTP